MDPTATNPRHTRFTKQACKSVSVAMLKTTDLECDWCGSLWVGADNPKEFWRKTCPKPSSCTAKIVSRYSPDEGTLMPPGPSQASVLAKDSSSRRVTDGLTDTPRHVLPNVALRQQT